MALKSLFLIIQLPLIRFETFWVCFLHQVVTVCGFQGTAELSFENPCAWNTNIGLPLGAEGKERNSKLASSLEVFDTFCPLHSSLPHTLEMVLKMFHENTNSLKEEEQEQDSYLGSES